MSNTVEREIELFKEKIGKENKPVTIEGQDLVEVPASQLLIFLKEKIEDRFQHLSLQEKIAKYRGILLEFRGLYITGDFIFTSDVEYNNNRVGYTDENGELYFDEEIPIFAGVFPCIILYDCIFEKNVLFENAIFAGEFIFHGIEFKGSVKFINIKFTHESPKMFNYSKFNYAVDFINVEMVFQEKTKNEISISPDNYIVIYQSLFNLLFIEVEFCPFSSAIFENTICNKISFEGAKFDGHELRFDNLTCQIANLERIVTNNQISLTIKDSKIMDRLDISNAPTEINLNLYKTEVNTIDCENSKFDSLMLTNVKVKDTAYFNKVLLNNNIDFSNNVTFNQADFSNAIFKKKANFATCIFNAVPLFHEATLHQDTSFEGAKFLRCETEEDYRAYRTLKQHMSDVHATLEESRFFALEQRTRLKLDENLYKKGKKELLSNILISRFYAAISDYGQDTFKPLILLLGMWLLFGLLFSLPHMVEVNPKYSQIAWIAPFNDSNWFINIIKGLGYSFQSTFNPLSLFAKDIPFVAQNIIVLILAYIELLCAITFIALWLLAVRRRFQKGE